MAKTDRTFAKTISAFLHRHHLLFVVLLSLLHVGLALTPLRDSGRADLPDTRASFGEFVLTLHCVGS
jgi:hypothetical protein